MSAPARLVLAADRESESVIAVVSVCSSSLKVMSGSSGLARRLRMGDVLTDPLAGDLPGGGVDAVEGVDGGNGQHQAGKLRLVVEAGRLVPHLVGNRVRPVGEPGGGLGQRQGSPLGVAEVRSFPPGTDHEDALVRLAGGLELRECMSKHTLHPLIWLARASTRYSVLSGTPALRTRVPSFCIASRAPGTTIAGFFIRGCMMVLQSFVPVPVTAPTSGGSMGMTPDEERM